EAQLAGLVFGKLDELASNALIFVCRADVQKGQLSPVLFGVGVQGNARNRVLIDLKNVIIRQLLLDAGSSAFDQLFAINRSLGQVENAADIFLHGPANLMEFVGIDQRADSLIRKDLREQSFFEQTADHMHPWNA